MRLFGKIDVVPNNIYEVLISTNNQEDPSDPIHPYNIAPMGIEFKNEKIFYVRPYKNTQTYKNLVIDPFFGINICHDVEIFYNSIFSKERFIKDLFIKTDDPAIPLLKASIASMACKWTSEKHISKERAEFQCELLSLQSWNDFFEPPCRARNLIIESLIHFTRLKVLKDMKKRDSLINQIFEYQDIIKRTSRNTTYEKIMSEIIKKVKNL